MELLNDNGKKGEEKSPEENEDETYGQYDLQDDIKRIKTLQVNYEKELENSKKDMERIQKEIEEAKRDVCREEKEICEKVREQTKEMMSALDRTHKEQRTAYENQQKDIEKGMKELSEHLQQLNALKDRSPSCHLRESERILEERSQELLEAPSFSGQVHRNVEVHCMTDSCLKRSLQDMGKIVISFGEVGSNEGQLNFPRSIAVSDNGEVAIADYSNHRIQIFSLDGNYLREFGSQGTGEGQLFSPRGVVFNEEGLLVGDCLSDGKGRIQEFDLNGTYVRTIYRPDQWFEPRGMCVNDDKDIAVCCRGQQELSIKPSIKVFSKQDLVHQIDMPDDNEQPRYITYVNRKYFVSFCDQNSVYVFNKNGIFLRKFGKGGLRSGQFNGVGGLAVYGPDNVLVCDEDNERVQLLTQEGEFLRSFQLDGYLGQRYLPLDLAVTADGRVVVMERFSGRVHVWC